jgi:transposase InsO family protein
VRPDIAQPGDLVQFDTVHLRNADGTRTYVYTALDVYSRYGFAAVSKKANAWRSVSFLKKARIHFTFPIRCLQTDNGPEFGLYFTDAAKRFGISHRHIHPRSPNENGHLERFNRTIQEEMPRHGLCISIADDIALYLSHYNTKRMHMGIDLKTPAQLVQK